MMYMYITCHVNKDYVMLCYVMLCYVIVQAANNFIKWQSHRRRIFSKGYCCLSGIIPSSPYSNTDSLSHVVNVGMNRIHIHN